MGNVDSRETIVGCGGFPSLDDIYQSVDLLAGRYPRTVEIESLGVSVEGREIKAVHVTDKTVPEHQKEIALVICGRHGQELGTRVLGTELPAWLLSSSGKETRQHQHVIIVPVANPDGCVRGEFWAPNDKLSEIEEKTIAAIAEAYQPDAVMDVHSWGGMSDGEAIVTANTRGAGEDVYIYESLAAEMAEHAAREGYPFLIHRARPSSRYNNFFCGMCYEKFHSLAFGMEVNHSALAPCETARSGIAVVEAFLNKGNTRSPWEPCTGYPNRILLGDFFSSIRPAGSNASERRQSRSEIWQNRRAFTAPKRRFVAPRAVHVATEHSGTALSCPFALVCRIRGFPELRKVKLNREDVEPTVYRDNCSTYVSVDVEVSGGMAYELTVEF